MKKQLLVLLMLGTFVGQVQGAEQSNQANILSSLENYLNFVNRDDINPLISEGQKMTRTKLTKAFNKLKNNDLDATEKGILIANLTDFSGVVSDLLKPKSTKVVGRLTSQQLKEFEAAQKREVEFARLAKEAQDALENKRKTAQEEQLAREKEEAAAKLAEKTRKAAEQLELRQREKAQREEAARLAAEEEALKLRLEAEALAKIALEEQLRAEQLRKEQARLAAEQAKLERIAAVELKKEQERVERERIADQERLAALKREEALRVARELELAQQAQKAAEVEVRKKQLEEEAADAEAMAEEELKITKALETIVRRIDEGSNDEVKDAVIANIPGFAGLSVESKKYLTLGGWEDESPQYYIALVAVQQVINYVYGHESRHLGNSHFDNPDVVNAHFYAMYQQMLGHQIKTELALRDTQVQVDIQKAVIAITELNHNFRESAGQASFVLEFEDTLGSSQRLGPSIGEITRLEPGSELRLGAPGPRGAASGWPEGNWSRAAGLYPKLITDEMINHEMKQFVSRLYQDLILSENSNDFKDRDKIPNMKKMILDYLKDINLQRVLFLNSDQINSIFTQLELRTEWIRSKEEAVGRIMLKLEELKQEAFPDHEIGSSRIWASFADDAAADDDADLFIPASAANDDNFFGAAAVADDSLFIRMAPSAFIISKDSSGETMINGMPILTKYLHTIAPRISSKAMIAGSIVLEGQLVSSNIRTELSNMLRGGGSPISEQAIKLMLNEFYKDVDGGTNSDNLVALSKAIYDLQISGDTIRLRRVDSSATASSEELLPIAKVISEHQKQQKPGGAQIGAGLTNLIEKHKYSLLAELDDVVASTAEEKKNYIKSIAASLGFTDEGELSYLINALLELKAE